MQTLNNQLITVLTIFALVMTACGTEESTDDGNTGTVLIDPMAEMGTTPTMEPTMTAPQDTATAANTQNADEMAPTAPETVPAAMETQPTTPEVPADEGQATEERPSLNLNLNVPADNELAFWKTGVPSIPTKMLSITGRATFFFRKMPIQTQLQ